MINNIEDVESFQLEINEMIRKLSGISDSLKAYNFNIDDLRIIYMQATKPSVGSVEVEVSGTTVRIPAKQISVCAIEAIAEIQGKIHPLMIRIQEAIDGQG